MNFDPEKIMQSAPGPYTVIGGRRYLYFMGTDLGQKGEIRIAIFAKHTREMMMKLIEGFAGALKN